MRTQSDELAVCNFSVAFSFSNGLIFDVARKSVVEVEFLVIDLSQQLQLPCYGHPLGVQLGCRSGRA